MVKEAKEVVDSNSLVLASFRKIKESPRNLYLSSLVPKQRPTQASSKDSNAKVRKMPSTRPRNFGNLASQKLVKYLIGIRDTKTGKNRLCLKHQIS